MQIKMLTDYITDKNEKVLEAGETYEVTATYNHLTAIDFTFHDIDNRNFTIPLDTYDVVSYGNGTKGIHSFLDVSTAHISKQDAEALKFRVEPNGAYIIGTYDEGWVLSIGEYNPDETQVGRDYSPQFYQVIDSAREMGCTLVRLDRDGTKFLNLTQFDW